MWEGLGAALFWLFIKMPLWVIWGCLLKEIYKIFTPPDDEEKFAIED